MFEQVRYELILEALQPIAHHEEIIGNEAFLMSTEVRQPDGRFTAVPIITGDTMRHKLREAGTYALLDAAGLLGTFRLSEGALRLLFAGGMVRGSSSSVKLETYRELCDLVPPLELLGGCAQNRIIPGRIQVGEALLICEETGHILPSWVGDYLKTVGACLESSRAHVQNVQRVRMDPVLDPIKREFLTDGAQERVSSKLRLNERAGELGNDIEKERTKSTNMPRRMERIKLGSLFYWSVSATLTSELSRDTFNTIVMAFLSNAIVGGKSGSGHGRIRAVTGRQIKIDRPASAAKNLDIKDLTPRVGVIFHRHVKDRSEKIKDFLEGVLA